MTYCIIYTMETFDVDGWLTCHYQDETLKQRNMKTVKDSTVTLIKGKLILYLLFVTRHVSQKTQ